MKARQNPPSPSPAEKSAIIRRAHAEAKVAHAKNPRIPYPDLFGEAMRRLYRAYAEGWLTEHCGATPADLAQLRAVSDGSYGHIQGKFRAAQKGRPDRLEARIDAAAGRLSADPEVQAVIRCGFPQPPIGQGRMRPALIPVVEAPAMKTPRELLNDNQYSFNQYNLKGQPTPYFNDFGSGWVVPQDTPEGRRFLIVTLKGNAYKPVDYAITSDEAHAHKVVSNFIRGLQASKDASRLRKTQEKEVRERVGNPFEVGDKFFTGGYSNSDGGSYGASTLRVVKVSGMSLTLKRVISRGEKAFPEELKPIRVNLRNINEQDPRSTSFTVGINTYRLVGHKPKPRVPTPMIVPPSPVEHLPAPPTPVFIERPEINLLSQQTIQNGLRQVGWEIYDADVNQTSGFARIRFTRTEGPRAGGAPVRVVTLMRSKYQAPVTVLREGTIWAVNVASNLGQAPFLSPDTFTMLGKDTFPGVASALKAIASYIQDNPGQGALGSDARMPLRLLAQDLGEPENVPFYLQTKEEAVAPERAELHRRENLATNDFHGLRGGGGKGKPGTVGGFSKRAWSQLQAEQERNSPLEAFDRIKNKEERHREAIRDAILSGDMPKAQYDQIHASSYGPYETARAFISRREAHEAALAARRREHDAREALKEREKAEKAARSAAHAAKVAARGPRSAGAPGSIEHLDPKHISTAAIGSVISFPGGEPYALRREKGWYHITDRVKMTNVEMQQIIKGVQSREAEFGSGRPITIQHGSGVDPTAPVPGSVAEIKGSGQLERAPAGSRIVDAEGLPVADLQGNQWVKAEGSPYYITGAQTPKGMMQILTKGYAAEGPFQLIYG